VLFVVAAAPAPAQPAAATLEAAHPLSPVAFLVGKWTGESRWTSAFDNASEIERTQSECALILGNAYLRCHTIFYSGDRERWQLDHIFRKGRKDPGIQARLLQSGYAGDWIYYLNPDASGQVLVAEYETETHGHQVIERYTMKPAADRNSFTQTEEVRLAAPGSPWRQTRIWTWARQK
jgi:hypothetical protein